MEGSSSDSGTQRRITLRSALTAVVTAVAIVAAGLVFLRLAHESGDDPASVPAGATLVTGATRAADVEVAQSSVDLGRVPVDKTIDQAFSLRNSGSGTATLGRPRIETLEGC